MKDGKQIDRFACPNEGLKREAEDGLLVWVLRYILEQIPSFVDVCTFSFLH